MIIREKQSIDVNNLKGYNKQTSCNILDFDCICDGIQEAASKGDPSLRNICHAGTLGFPLFFYAGGKLGSVLGGLFIVCTGGLTTCSVIDIGSPLLRNIGNSLHKEFGSDDFRVRECESIVNRRKETYGTDPYGVYRYTTCLFFNAPLHVGEPPAEFARDVVVGLGKGTYNFVAEKAPNIDFPLSQIHPTGDYFELANRAKEVGMPNADQLFEAADHLGEKAEDVKADDLVP